MRLILVTTLFKDSADKLDRFLRYYQRFQFDDVIVVENDEDFTEESKCKKEREGIIEHLDGLLDDTWVCYADLDEFQEYPISLYRSIQQAEDLGFDFLEGRLIDRLSMDGRLVPEREPLELTFPVGAFVTRVLMNGWDKKIMAAKASVALGGGHHVRKNKGGLRFNNYDVQPYVPELAPFCYGN